MKKTSYMMLTDVMVSKAQEDLKESVTVLDDYNSEYKTYDTSTLQGDIIKAIRMLDDIKTKITEYGQKCAKEEQA